MATTRSTRTISRGGVRIRITTVTETRKVPVRVVVRSVR